MCFDISIHSCTVGGAVAVLFETGCPVPAGRAGLTAAEITQQLGLNTQPGFRGVTDWLDVLVTLETLQRSGKCTHEQLSETNLQTSGHSARACIYTSRLLRPQVNFTTVALHVHCYNTALGPASRHMTEARSSTSAE